MVVVLFDWEFVIVLLFGVCWFVSYMVLLFFVVFVCKCFVLVLCVV